MTLVRYQPFAPRLGWGHGHSNLNRCFNMFDEDESRTVWQPRINVVDLEDKFEISAELPGMNREDVSIELNNNVLTISGEKREEHEKKERNVYRRERVFGKFQRSFRLSPEIESDKIEAKFENGILTLSLPKSEKTVSKKIEIQAN